MPTHAFTIRKFADAAGVGVEAVRYYQRRGLLAEPSRSDGGFRQYTEVDVRRLRFIKRAQDLGFSLDDVAELASLDADNDRSRVREIAQRRVLEIRSRVESLNSLATALEGLANCCARASDLNDCPILAALAEDGDSVNREFTAPDRTSKATRPIRGRLHSNQKIALRGNAKESGLRS